MSDPFRRLEMLDRPYVVRRILLLWLLIVSSVVIWWVFRFAYNSPRPGMEVAAIIGAVNTPLCFLFGAMMGLFREIPQPKEGS